MPVMEKERGESGSRCCSAFRFRFRFHSPVCRNDSTTALLHGSTAHTQTMPVSAVGRRRVHSLGSKDPAFCLHFASPVPVSQEELCAAMCEVPLCWACFHDCQDNNAPVDDRKGSSGRRNLPRIAWLIPSHIYHTYMYVYKGSRMNTYIIHCHTV